MTKYLIIFGVIIVMAIVGGCTQPASPGQPPATMTVNDQTQAYPTGTTTPTAQSTNRVNDNTIVISKDGFDPVSITVKSGSIVRWRNADSTADATLYRSYPQDFDCRCERLGSPLPGARIQLDVQRARNVYL